MKIKVRMTPEQYKCVGQVLFLKREEEIDISVMAFLKEAFDLASKKAVRLYKESCELTEIQETLGKIGNMEETNERSE